MNPCFLSIYMSIGNIKNFRVVFEASPFLLDFSKRQIKSLPPYLNFTLNSHTWTMLFTKWAEGRVRKKDFRNISDRLRDDDFVAAFGVGNTQYPQLTCPSVVSFSSCKSG